jgi:hypothetical protein
MIETFLGRASSGTTPLPTLPLKGGGGDLLSRIDFGCDVTIKFEDRAKNLPLPP